MWEVHLTCCCVINTDLLANRARQIYHLNFLFLPLSLFLFHFPHWISFLLPSTHLQVCRSQMNWGTHAKCSDAKCPLPALCHQLSFWCLNQKCCCAVTTTFLFQAAIHRAFSCTFTTSLPSLSLSKSPLTNAACTGPENEARWWVSRSHQSHCSCVSIRACVRG